MTKRLTLWKLIPALGVLFIGCRENRIQDPKELFVDGKLPSVLERLANQIHELPYDRILSRVQSDNQNKNLLPVAVIDNGLDLANPQIVDQVQFDVENGRIIGAGIDLMGNDRFASPQLVDPTLLAFGAEDVVDGKIKGPSKNPMDLIVQYQDHFVQSVLVRVQADPELKGTIWPQIIQNHLYLMGELNSELLLIKYGMKYEPPKEDGKIHADIQSLNTYLAGLTGQAKDEFFEKHDLAGFYDLFLESKNITPKEQSNASDLMALAQRELKGSIRVAGYIHEELQNVLNKTKFKQDIQNLSKFMKGAKINSEPLGSDELEKLHAGYVYKKEGFKFFHPKYQFLIELRKGILFEKLQAMTQLPNSEIVLDRHDYETALENIYNVLKNKASDFVTNSDGSQDPLVIQKVNRLKKYLPFQKEFALKMLASIPDQALNDLRPESMPLTIEERRNLIRSTHPYVNKESLTESHGTHTAGTIAVQNKDIRIFPVRVLTSSFVNQSKEMIQQNEILLKEDLKKFLLRPEVFSAFVERFGKLVPELTSNLAMQNKDNSIQQFLERYHVFIKDYAEKSSLDVEFRKQVLKSIEVIGSKKIKVASMSLGLEQDSDVENDTLNMDKSAQREKMFKFLIMEMFKLELGETIANKAPQTLFFVAAGNSGKWIDSWAKSALPVDISSPWLASQESKGFAVTANNKIKNIIGIGSIQSDGTSLSSFTNLILGSKNPVYYADGENVLAPVRSMDRSYVEGIVGAIDYSFSDLIMNISGQMTSGARSPKNIHEYDQFSKQTAAVKPLSDLFVLEAHSNLKYPLGRMSGTSMATPTAAGLVASVIQKEMAAKNLSSEEIYNHPDFTVEKILQKIEGLSRPIRSGNIVDQLKKLGGEKLQEDQDKLRQVRKFIFNGRQPRFERKCENIFKTLNEL